jgi:DnaK suppressor protein
MPKKTQVPAKALKAKQQKPASAPPRAPAKAAVASAKKAPAPAPLKSASASTKQSSAVAKKPALASKAAAASPSHNRKNSGLTAPLAKSVPTTAGKMAKLLKAPITAPEPDDDVPPSMRSRIQVPRPRVKRTIVDLPPGYKPTEREPFMNELQREYFRRKLVAWKDEINRETQETLSVLHEDSTQHADIADRATSETDRALELRARDRQRKLIAKIDAAVGRIDDGSYGYCEDTGEPIGIKRLDARPIATLSIEAQERHERRERVYRDE